MNRLILILIAVLCLTACNWQAAKTHASDPLDWETTVDTISLANLIEPYLKPMFYIFSPSESKGNLYFSVNEYTNIQHYGDRLDEDFHFCMTPNGQISKTTENTPTPKEGKIPLIRTKEWDINYIDVGEWGNYLSFTGSGGEYVFRQFGRLRALFIQNSDFLTISYSAIARVANPSFGRRMIIPKRCEFQYYENGAENQDVLWKTDALLIEWGEADTIIHGAFMVDDQLMLAMYIDGNTGIYTFDGKEFHLEHHLGAISLWDNYSTLKYQLSNPNGFISVFEDANKKQGILYINGHSIHIVYVIFPDRPWSVTSTDPTIPLINSLVDISGLTMKQVDSVEQVYGGETMGDNQYYTLLPDKSYLQRTYKCNDSTGQVIELLIDHRGGKDWYEWQNAILDAFWDELSPAVSSIRKFVMYESRRFTMHLYSGADHSCIFVTFASGKESIQ